MTKKRLNLRNAAAIFACLAGITVFSGCDKDNDPNDKNGNAEGTPKTVMNFTATAGDGQVSLSWNAPSDDGGSEITGYEVTRDNWANKETKTANQLSHIYNGLTNDTQYTFKVRAINVKGAGEESVQIATPTAGGNGSGKSITITGFDAAVNGDYIEVFLYSTYPAAPIAGGGSQGTSTIQNGKGTVKVKELKPPGNPWNGSGTFIVQLLLWKSGAMDSYADLWYTGGGNISVVTFMSNAPKYSIVGDNTEIGFDKFGSLQ